MTYLLSVVLKGIGALLEMGIQISITRTVGLAGYGSYALWVNAADLLFWLFFSGIIKLNTYYLAAGGSMTRFKGRYYLRYVLPMSVMMMGAAAISGNAYWVPVIFIALLELLAMDRSSVLLAHKKHIPSLLGEYVLGRAVMLGIVLTLGACRPGMLVGGYLLQYAVICLFFAVQSRGEAQVDVSGSIALAKLVRYQRGDVMQTAITQLPVLVQYMSQGAAEAGVVSLILLVKKLVNFISGPSAKIFLPEFSRAYREGKPEKIGECYRTVMELQMLIVAPLAVVLIGFPEVILGVAAKELTDHGRLFAACAAGFLVSTSMGPGFGVMQMTGHEKEDNRFRAAGLLLALLLWGAARRTRFGILWAVVAEALFESVGKYIYICVYLQRMPVRPAAYVRWWIWPVAVIGAVSLLGWQRKAWLMLLLGVATFAGYGGRYIIFHRRALRAWWQRREVSAGA